MIMSCYIQSTREDLPPWHWQVSAKLQHRVGKSTYCSNVAYYFIKYLNDIT